MRFLGIVWLSLLQAACGQSDPTRQPETTMQSLADDGVRASFLRVANGDEWANWPEGLEDEVEDEGQPCERVSEQSREQAIARLEQAPAVAIDVREYELLAGMKSPIADGNLYLLRGFSTNNSAATVKVIGNTVTVRSESLGGLFNLRRHPCIAPLTRAPARVYTTATYFM
jgi:hypothetical protein